PEQHSVTACNRPDLSKRVWLKFFASVNPLTFAVPLRSVSCGCTRGCLSRGPEGPGMGWVTIAGVATVYVLMAAGGAIWIYRLAERPPDRKPCSAVRADGPMVAGLAAVAHGRKDGRPRLGPFLGR